MATAESTDTRARIVDAATRAMIAKSYNGVGLSEILQCADVPKGSFYHFFKSKETLGIAVVEKSTADHLVRLQSFYSDRSKPPIGRLRAYFDSIRRELLDEDAQKECVVCKLALEQASLSDLMRAAIRCGFDQSVALTAQLFREAQASGDIDPNWDAQQLADFVNASAQGAMIHVQVNGDIGSFDTCVHFLFDVLLKKA